MPCNFSAAQGVCLWDPRGLVNRHSHWKRERVIDPVARTVLASRTLLGNRVDIAVALAAALVFGGGCGASTTTASTPRATLTTLAVAARRGDAATLYALLPERARQAENFATFRARIAADRAELARLGEEVQQSLAGPRAPLVGVALADGERVTAQHDPDDWRLASPGFGPPSAAEAEDAVRALHDALSRRSLGALLAVLSARARGSLEAEMSALLEGTRDASGLSIVRTSQRATVYLPDGRQIELVRDGDAWRVDEIR